MAYKHSRTSYIPNNAQPMQDDASSAVAYIYKTAKGTPGAVMFQGKAQKPASHYTYRTDAHLARAISDFFKSVRSREAYRAESAAKRKAYVNDYKVGEVLVATWGYEQTNVDYYEVTASKGATIEIRKLATQRVETDFMQGYSTPCPGEYVGEATKHRPNADGVKIASYCNAHRAEFQEVAGVKVYRSYHWTAYA